MMTGLHTVKSVICKKCRSVIGWTYVFAYEPREKYKEGKFIIEKEYMIKQKVPEMVEDSVEDLDEQVIPAEINSGEAYADEKDGQMDATIMLTGRSTNMNTISLNSTANLISERDRTLTGGDS
jgi:hypothetical protein